MEGGIRAAKPPANVRRWLQVGLGFCLVFAGHSSVQSGWYGGRADVINKDESREVVVSNALNTAGVLSVECADGP